MKKYAVIGGNVTNSLSPAFNKEFAKLIGIDITYETINSTKATFNQDVRDFFESGGLGLNVTAPFKEMAYELCDLVQEFNGSINTIYKCDNHLVGHSTDGIAFINSLKSVQYSLCYKRILIIGSGGVVRAILPSILSENPDCVMICSRDFNKAVALANNINKRNVFAVQHDMITDNIIDIIINATSFDIVPKHLDDKISSSTLAYDLNYNGTKFLDWAESKNLSVCNGRRMLREVAKLSCYIWHGEVID